MNVAPDPYAIRTCGVQQAGASRSTAFSSSIFVSVISLDCRRYCSALGEAVCVVCPD